MIVKTPEEIKMEADLKAALGSKFDLEAVPEGAAVIGETPAQKLDLSDAHASPAEVKDGTPVIKAPASKTEETPKVTLDKLMDRIADMESGWDRQKKEWEARLAAKEQELAEAVRAPAPQIEVPEAKPVGPTLQDFLADPAGVLRANGIPFDYVAKSLVAAELRKQGRPDPVMEAAVGAFPAFQAMSNQMAALAAKLESIEAETAEAKYQESITKSTVKVEKEKYPNVAEAAGRDKDSTAEWLREIVMNDSKGKPKTAPRMTPEKAMEVLEKRLALAKALVAPAPTGTQGDAAGNTSPKIPPATAANLNGSTGPVMTPAQTLDDFDKQLKAQIVRQFGERAQA